MQPVQINTPSLYHVHCNPIGAPILLTDSNGSAVWSAQYAPFGDAIIDEDPDGDGRGVTFNLRFPGQYYDTESGLHYNWHRYYDPETGRYVTADPIGLTGGINQYAYVGGNPVSFVDSEGLAYFAYRPLCGIGGIFGVIGGEDDDRLNTVIGHEQLFFQDGKKDTNAGFFNDGEAKTDPNLEGYESPHDSGWSDCVMREAVKRVPNRKYQLLWEHDSNYKYNCQDWADEVRRIYRQLIHDPSVIRKCRSTCKGANK